MPSSSLSPAAAAGSCSTTTTATKYVPPSRRAGAECSANASSVSAASFGAAAGRRGGGGESDVYEIKIEGLSAWADEQSVRDMCAAFGEIRKLYVSVDKDTQRCKGHAWVTFRKFTDMNRAIGRLHNTRMRTGVLTATRAVQDGDGATGSGSGSRAGAKQAPVADRADLPQFDADFPSLGTPSVADTRV